MDELDTIKGCWHVQVAMKPHADPEISAERQREGRRLARAILELVRRHGRPEGFQYCSITNEAQRKRQPPSAA